MKKNLRSVVAFIGIGSNENDPAEQCRRAVAMIAAAGSISILRKSSLYSTEPVGVADQDWFVNAAVEIRTALQAVDLLGVLKDIEAGMGRTPGLKWGPRTIDLDILLYGQEVVRQERLIIPHPDLHRRRFVLVPLAEIASFVIHPDFGVSIKGLMERLEDPHGVFHLSDTWQE